MLVATGNDVPVFAHRADDGKVQGVSAVLRKHHVVLGGGVYHLLHGVACFPNFQRGFQGFFMPASPGVDGKVFQYVRHCVDDDGRFVAAGSGVVEINQSAPLNIFESDVI